MSKIYLIPILIFVCISGATTAQPWKSAYDSASFYWQKEDWNHVILHLSSSERFAKNDLGIYDPNYLSILNDLGLAHLNAGLFDKAESLLTESLQLRKEILDKDDPELITSYFNYARIKAIKDPQKALICLKQLQTEYPEEDAHIALLLGDVYKQTGRYDSASYWYFEPEKLANDPVSDQLFLKRISILRVSGKFDSATQLARSFIQQIQSDTISSKKDILSRALREAGLTALQLGLYQDAEKLLVQSNELCPVSEVASHVASINALAALYAQIGLTDRAFDYLQQALNTVPYNSSDYHKIQQNRAALYEQSGDFDNALNIYSEEIHFSKTPVDKINLMINLSLALEGLDRSNEADSILQQGRKIAATNEIPPPLRATLLSNSGLTALRKSDFPQAKIYLEEALGINSDLYGQDAIVLADLQNNLGLVYLATGETTTAMKLISDAIKSEQKLIRYTFPLFSRQEKMIFYHNLEKDFARFNAIVTTFAPTDQALVNAMFDKQLLLKGLMLKASVAPDITDPQQAALVTKLNESRRELTSFYKLSVRQDQGLSAKIATLENSILDQEKILAHNFPDKTDHYLNDGISWKDINQKLSSGEALVELIRVNEFKTESEGNSSYHMGFTNKFTYVALVLKAGTLPHLVALDNGKEMENQYYNFYQNSIHFNIPDTASYAHYWGQISDQLGDVSTVYVVNDGVYHKLNLNNLYDSRTNSFLIQEMDIHLLVNPGDILGTSPEKINDRSAFLAGDPLPITLNTTKETLKLESLPYSRNEIDAIATMMSKSQWTINKFLDKNATVKNLMKNKDHSVIHIATHGFFSADLLPTESKLADAGLIASGLVFSSTDSTENPILTGYEILGMDFSHTDLVVLSACETGLGQIHNGEGIDGLQRAFLGSGVRTLILSLWQVDDKATQELMVKFYSRYLNGMNKRESFREAQLEMIRSGYGPRYWSAFIMAGE